MKVSIDSDLCQGHARCWDICPEVFEVDEQGYGLVALPEVPPIHEARAREAAENCPERAITID
ncbi:MULTISPECIES: ferredoxin [Parafrankia]|uniref:Ferredoxin n=1 Tax=Parafrankia colletiae TaxID=573497 RepID=A0A1S1RJH8_9ACTN|nr:MULTISPECIES: ferredoxin [Parafrankia]MCK9899276.1 ferredoxin [Frankia sp. Cpl3]OHV45939.1 ferredoxin [Parafrankia colletiae]